MVARLAATTLQQLDCQEDLVVVDPVGIILWDCQAEQERQDKAMQAGAAMDLRGQQIQIQTLAVVAEVAEVLVVLAAGELQP